LVHWEREVQMFGSLGLPELLLIALIIVLLFGVNKLPRLGRGLGEGIKNFKESLRGGAAPPESSGGDGKDDQRPTAPR
jgi:sec-independent protein translocase protein TatA